PAISFFVNCETDAELDKIWGVLSEDATTLMPLQAYPFSEKFGWLQDKYGVSWQVNLGARPQKITPYFTFVGEQFGKAEEAITFYTSLFENSGVDNILRYDTDEDGGKVGAIKQALFRLN
ncbi:MAG TPA: VOC family protein, partial [Aggregatilineales bacterium]|nr:VOC family protein [Aggregatilineales bacterium]